MRWGIVVLCSLTQRRAGTTVRAFRWPRWVALDAPKAATRSIAHSWSGGFATAVSLKGMRRAEQVLNGGRG